MKNVYALFTSHWNMLLTIRVARNLIYTAWKNSLLKFRWYFFLSSVLLIHVVCFKITKHVVYLVWWFLQNWIEQTNQISVNIFRDFVFSYVWSWKIIFRIVYFSLEIVLKIGKVCILDLLKFFIHCKK